jgi:hypothetical protein
MFVLNVAIVVASLLGFCFVTTYSIDLDDEWNQFKLTYGKVYATAEEEIKRKSIWNEKYLHVMQADANGQFQIAVNQHSDKSIEVVVLWVFDLLAMRRIAIKRGKPIAALELIYLG